MWRSQKDARLDILAARVCESLVSRQDGWAHVPTRSAGEKAGSCFVPIWKIRKDRPSLRGSRLRGLFQFTLANLLRLSFHRPELFRNIQHCEEERAEPDVSNAGTGPSISHSARPLAPTLGEFRHPEGCPAQFTLRAASGQPIRQAQGRPSPSCRTPSFEEDGLCRTPRGSPLTLGKKTDDPLRIS
jgi:hypothetical protein